MLRVGTVATSPSGLRLSAILESQLAVCIEPDLDRCGVGTIHQAVSISPPNETCRVSSGSPRIFITSSLLIPSLMFPKSRCICRSVRRISDAIQRLVTPLLLWSGPATGNLHVISAIGSCSSVREQSDLTPPSLLVCDARKLTVY